MIVLPASDRRDFFLSYQHNLSHVFFPPILGYFSSFSKKPTSERCVISHIDGHQGALLFSIPCPIGPGPCHPGSLGCNRFVVISGDGTTKCQHRLWGILAYPLRRVRVSPAANCNGITNSLEI